MNKSLEEKANKLLDLLIDGIEKGADLASSEAPKILEEYLTYFYIQQIPIFGIIGVLVSFILALIIFKMYKHYENIRIQNKDKWSSARSFVDEMGDGVVFVYFLCIAASLFLIFISTLDIAGSVSNMLQIKHAPKAYLIEKIRK